MASLKYLTSIPDFQTGTVGSDYTSGGTSLVLTTGHGARFPTSGDFWIRVDDEILKVTARSTDTLTVAGAQDGTSAANHSTGATVRWVEGPAALDQLRIDQCGVGSFASRPSSEKAGKLYLPSDSPYILRDSGSLLQPWAGLALTPPPAVSSLTWVNQGSATADETYGGFILQADTTGGFNLRGLVKTIPTAPFRFTVGFLLQGIPNFRCGIVMRNSADGKMVTHEHYVDGNLSFNGDNWSSPTGPGGIYGPNAANYSHSHCGMHFLQLHDDNTNWNFNYLVHPSAPATTRFSEARNTYTTPDQIGVFINSDTGATFPFIWVLHWVEA